MFSKAITLLVFLMSTILLSSLFLRAKQITSLFTTIKCKRLYSPQSSYHTAGLPCMNIKGADSLNQDLGFPYAQASPLKGRYIGTLERNFEKLNEKPFEPRLLKLNTTTRPVYPRNKPIKSMSPEYYQLFKYYGADVSFFTHYNTEEPDHSKWKATGVRTILTKDFLTYGVQSVGKKAYSKPFYPPGWGALESPTRGHLLAKQLGGDGRYWLNIVSLNRRINCVEMNKVERVVANVYKRRNGLSDTCSILYLVKALYMPTIDYPVAIYIYAAVINQKDATFIYPWLLYQLTQSSTKEIFKNPLPEEMHCPAPRGPPVVH